MFSSFLVSALSYIRVVRDELVVTCWFCFTVVTFFISWSQHDGIRLHLQYKLLSLPADAELLLFLFNLWRLWVLLVQTGVPLLVTELLVNKNLLLLLLTDMLLWKLWRDREQKTENIQINQLTCIYPPEIIERQPSFTRALRHTEQWQNSKE